MEFKTIYIDKISRSNNIHLNANKGKNTVINNYGSGSNVDPNLVNQVIKNETDIAQNKKDIKNVDGKAQSALDRVGVLEPDFYALSEVVEAIPQTYLSKVKNDEAKGKITLSGGAIVDSVLSKNYTHGNGFGIIRSGDYSKFEIGGANESKFPFDAQTKQQFPTAIGQYDITHRRLGISIAPHTEKRFLRFEVNWNYTPPANFAVSEPSVYWWMNNDEAHPHYLQPYESFETNKIIYQIDLPVSEVEYNVNINVNQNYTVTKTPQQKLTVAMTVKGVVDNDYTYIYGVKKITEIDCNHVKITQEKQYVDYDITGMKIMDGNNGIWYSINGIKHTSNGGIDWI